MTNTFLSCKHQMRANINKVTRVFMAEEIREKVIIKLLPVF